MRNLVSVTPGPWPVAQMLRIGYGVGVGFLITSATGNMRDGVVGAIFANLLGFVDQDGPLRERVAILLAAIVFIAAGAVAGQMCSGREPLIVAVVFGMGVVAGIAHGWLPGVEAIPRNALVAFLACAYLPLINAGTAWGGAVGAIGMVAIVVVDGLLRRVDDAPKLSDLRASARLRELRYGVCFGVAAAGGLLFADLMGATRGYWVAITTVVVMQPDSLASVYKAVQRLIGTVGGILLALLMTILIAHTSPVWGAMAVILVMPFLWPAAFAKNYTFGVLLLSAWILVMINLALPPTETGHVFLARFYDTALGSLFAIIGTACVDPRAFWAAFKQDTGLDAVVSAPAGPEAVPDKPTELPPGPGAGSSPKLCTGHAAPPDSRA